VSKPSTLSGIILSGSAALLGANGAFAAVTPIVQPTFSSSVQLTATFDETTSLQVPQDGGLTIVPSRMGMSLVEGSQMIALKPETSSVSLEPDVLFQAVKANGFAPIKLMAQTILPQPSLEVPQAPQPPAASSTPLPNVPQVAPAAPPSGSGQPNLNDPSSSGAMFPNVKTSIVDGNQGGIPRMSQGGVMPPDANTQPGVIPSAPAPATAPTNVPRAVPPPVGDISTSSFGAVSSQIDFETDQRVPRLLLREAPIREVLSLLARSAGMNVVFANDPIPASGQAGAGQPPATPGATSGEGPKISLDIENEPIQNVFNYVLQVGGLQANRVGRTIFVGTRLPTDARNVIIRSMRLNQVAAVDAANFLSAQGAESQIPITRITIQQVGTGLNARDVEIREPDIKALSAKEGTGALLLSGLSIVTDARLNSLTMIGDPKKIEIATNLLTQLDARRRQVIVNVKIIDINLNNLNNQNSSFSFSVGENFFSVDNGALVYNYGPSRPPTNAEVTTSPFYVSPTVVPLNIPDPGGFLDFNSGAPYASDGFSTVPGDPNLGLVSAPTYSRPPLGTTASPFQPGVTEAEDGRLTFSAPSLYQFPSQFLARIQAAITTRNAKILTDPTLVVQEGQTAKVDLTQQVVGNVTSTTTSSEGLVTQTVTANIVNAGLELNVNVERIDDNGFVTLTVNPKVTSIGADQNLNVAGNDNVIRLLNTRNVESGRIRLRDGQTLILSGIIQDSDRTVTNKVPLLGDIPIIGTLFRSTSKTNDRQEVIVLLTPQIMDDSDRATFGYGYNAGPEVQKLLNR
jgi:type IV pilus assembly protein PilQ